MTKKLLDAQAALTFLTQEAAYIETEVEKIEYPEVQYADLIPVDFSAPEWTRTVTYYSTDVVGKADWFAAQARDVPRVDLTRAKHETQVEMAAIGYGYDIEELSVAQAAGVRLTQEKAETAKQIYEIFVDDVALRGDETKGFEGLIDYTGVEAITVAADGTGSSTFWKDKTPAKIVRDFNAGIRRIWTKTKQLGMGDTVLLPIDDFAYLAETIYDANGNFTIMDLIQRTNIYTVQTGQKLTIKAVRGLESAGTGGTGRMIIYKRDPKVLKMHIPMRHKFLDPMRTGPLLYEVPGIFRLGGVDVKRPAFILYVDGISEPE